MHARFNLDPSSHNWNEFISYGCGLHVKNKRIVQESLAAFKNADNILNGTDIIKNWFPSIKANVFLSHSHKDSDVAIGLAGWLNHNFGLTSFIDSTVWGYADELLRLIDDDYCYSEKSNQYNYKKRNRSTSHVHTMLSTALMDMIDRCECIIFINTEHAFKPADYFTDLGATESPWIFSEIAMTRMLRERSLEEHRGRSATASSTALENLEESSGPKFSYELDLFHLTPLKICDLEKWKTENATRGDASLNSLYTLMKKKSHV